MRPVEVIATNHNFGPPPGKEGEIGDLPCEWVRHGDGSATIYSVWQLDDEDRKAIANGWNIRLGVGWIGGFPPVSLGVTHEAPIMVRQSRPSPSPPPPPPPPPPRPPRPTESPQA